MTSNLLCLCGAIPMRMAGILPKLQAKTKPFSLKSVLGRDLVTAARTGCNTENWCEGFCCDKPDGVACRPLEWVYRRNVEEFGTVS